MLWDEGLRNGYFSEICQNAGIGGDIVCQRIQNLRVFFGYRSLKDKKLILDIFLAGLFGHSRAKIGAVDSKNIYGGRALDDFLIVKGLREIGFPCALPEGAFYAFPRISETGLSDGDFARRLLEEEKVAIVPGSAFGPCGTGHVRLAY